MGPRSQKGTKQVADERLLAILAMRGKAFSEMAIRGNAGHRSIFAML